jgi:GNAT superfamily N-acetyltransferase
MIHLHGISQDFDFGDMFARESTSRCVCSGEALASPDSSGCGKAVKLMSHIARVALREHFEPTRAGDHLYVAWGTAALQINYIASRVSTPPGDVTRLDLRCHLDCREMWIRQLHVAMPFRLRGLGTDLVRVAESIAAALGLRAVHTLPLTPARRFWSKLGYVPQERTARVLVKRVERG